MLRLRDVAFRAQDAQGETDALTATTNAPLAGGAFSRPEWRGAAVVPGRLRRPTSRVLPVGVTCNGVIPLGYAIAQCLAVRHCGVMTETPTAKEIWTSLNAAAGTPAVIAAAKQYLPPRTSVALTDGGKTWRIQTMCCGSPFNGTRAITSARSDLAKLVREAMDHTATHGWTPAATRTAQAANAGRCEECGGWLTDFDRVASPVPHLHFDCA